MCRTRDIGTLSDSIQCQANDPAYLYDSHLIKTAAEQHGGIPLFGRGPVQPFEPLADPGFFGGVAHAAGAGKESNHLHPRQWECYVCLSGILRITCCRGNVTKDYQLAPHDLLLVPSGVWHHVQWIEAGMAYVFRTPTTGGVEKLIFNPDKPYGL